MASDRKADSKLTDRICSVLTKGKQYRALEIAKAVGLQKASDVNSVLYALFKSGRLSKTDSQPPLWSLGKPEETTSPASPTAAKSSDKKTVHENDIMNVFTETSENDRKALKASQIASRLGESRSTVNKVLYDMSRNGVVKKSEENQWSLVNGEKNQSERSDNQNKTRKTSEYGFSRNFDVIQALGSGGYGSVVKVKHKVDDKFYAVKTVQFTKEADREVKALAKLDHPNIVRYITSWPESVHWKDNSELKSIIHSEASYDGAYSSDIEKELHEMHISEPPETDTEGSSGMEASESSGILEESGTSGAKMSHSYESDSQDLVPLNEDEPYLYIQMEICEKGTLSTWLKERNMGTTPRKTQEIFKIFQQVVTGVEYIHSKGLIHRDLKPDNILFGDDDAVKIGDFGLVTTVADENGGPVERSRRRGTLSYMSPEQKESVNYDEKTDIFPLGLICFELLWKISTYMEKDKMWENVRSQAFPRDFCEKYQSESKFIEGMLAKNPSERQSAKETLESLKNWFSART
ncbi:LOW QUALITY PROTEIN: protein kinase containing Z-DNA binding domains [Chanos chanos]|uniref:non-specific serine/threonine protein kinase n=1 Tax=Chanos chanos TaxID=29144 RepID=A0A6J2V8K1_CHACN|nr:LOW QUALITY PROTEIN: interferon-induced, double-stranded RNA-activated protein kinase [Chanos chanos]